MADCKIDIKNSTPKFIATELRKTADKFDPWTPVLSSLFWIFVGMSIIATMDYGDLWFCVGQCQNVNK